MAQNGSAAAEQRYVMLDALRGVAAMAVVLFHSRTLLGFTIMPGGYLAVDLFFALSRFVIAHAYDRRLADGLGVGRFLLLRLVRFWPLYALGIAIGFVGELGLIFAHTAHALRPANALRTLVLALLFLPTAWSLKDQNLFPYNIPSWSLFIELIVNLAYAAAFPRLGRNALLVVAAIGAAFLIPGALTAGSADLGAQLGTLGGGFARALFSFPAGVPIYRSGWRRWSLPTPVLLAAVVVLLAAPVPAMARGAYDLVFILFLSPLLVLIGAGTAPSSGLGRTCAAIGIISFPIYAIHRPLLALAQPVAQHLHAPILIGVPLILLLIPGSLLLDRYYDVPMRKRLTAIFGIRRERPLPEASLP